MQEALETQVGSLGREHPLEEEMATYSSILAVIIPGQQNTIYEVAKSQTRLSN